MCDQADLVLLEMVGGQEVLSALVLEHVACEKNDSGSSGARRSLRHLWMSRLLEKGVDGGVLMYKPCALLQEPNSMSNPRNHMVSTSPGSLPKKSGLLPFHTS